MNELVNLVSEKTGLSEDMSRLAVETVVDYLKDKLPAPIASQVDGLLSGDTNGGAESIMSGLGDLFGSK